MQLRISHPLRALLFGASVWAVGLIAAGTTARADFLFDPDGPGGANPATSITGFDPSPGNALASGGVTAIQNFITGSGPTTFQLYYQAVVGTLVNSSGSFTPTGLGSPGTPGSTFELTVVASVTERVTGANLATGTANFATASVQSPDSFLQMYYGVGPTFNSNNLLGTGFKDGTLILSATPVSDAASIGSFSNSGAAQLFDQHGPDNYSGKQSVVGNGTSTLDFHVNSTNPGFFITPPPTVVGLSFQTNTNAPFIIIDPSMVFAGLGSGGSDVTPNLGSINGQTGPDFQFVADANITGVVPEPSGLCLMTLGLLGALGYGRRLRRRPA